jgi:hypothetical protein
MVNLDDYELVEGFCCDCEFTNDGCPSGCGDNMIWRKKEPKADDTVKNI